MTKNTRMQRRAAFEARQLSAAKEMEQLKSKLALKHSLTRNSRFDYAWNAAWSNGHAFGLSEVESCFDELVPLLKP